MKYIIPVFFCLGLSAGGCRKDSPFREDDITGQWKWISRTATDSSAVITTETAGAAQYLQLNRNLTWSLISNRKAVTKGVYRLKTLINPGGGTAAMILYTHDEVIDSMVVYNVYKDTLSVYTPGSKTGNNLYVR